MTAQQNTEADNCYYVSDSGCDFHSGKIPDAAADDGPFKTLEKAVKTANLHPFSLEESGIPVIHIRGGKYSVTETMKINNKIP
ncbi:MAG: hypothetical protein ACYTFY_22370, partial [Planctomycetota bacterium]